MKRLKRITAMLLFGLAAMLMTGAVQAKPKIAGYKIGIKFSYDSKKKAPVPAFGADICVKNLTEDSEISGITCSSTCFKLDKNSYATDVDDQGECILVLFGNGKPGNISTEDLTVEFDVKDGDSGKTWHLKTTCSFKGHKPFKALKAGGKNVLAAARENMYYAEMKIAGKRASVTYKLNKGYKLFKTKPYLGIKLYRGKKTIEVKDSTKLKKEDCLIISTFSGKYATKGGDDFAIIVK